MGDARGRWDGDTLVVDTTNFTDKTAVGQTPTSEAFHLIERLTRVAADTISYEATIEDPQVWVRPWKVALPLTTQAGYRLYPYECHEGNYALRNILSAARMEERAAEEARAKGLPPPPASPWQGNDLFLPADPSFGRPR
jgi:hypothetical protein